jgi:hypothetical protein
MPNKDLLCIWTSCPMSYFASKLELELSLKKYDGVIMLESSFQSCFHIFATRCIIDFIMIPPKKVKSGILGNWQCFFPPIEFFKKIKISSWSIGKPAI